MVKKIFYFVFWTFVNFIVVHSSNVNNLILIIIQMFFCLYMPELGYKNRNDNKQVPLKIKSPVISDDKVGGYCPTCQGTVLIEKTILRRFKGYYCSWCGQKIDCDEFFKEE